MNAPGQPHGGHKIGDQMSALRLFISLFALSSLLAAPLLAQQDDHGGPVPPAEFAPCDVAVGYSYVNTNLSGNPSVNLNGLETSATIDFNRRWGAALDSSYVRAGRDPGSGHSSYVLSAFAGPVFAATQKLNTRLLVRALAGLSLVDGSVPVNQLYYRGWQSRFSWAVGMGIERKLSRPFAVRFNIDYLRTKFVSPAAVVEPQNGIRLSANLVFRFAARHEPRQVAAREP
jgi:opacity protein-like surface antigen